MKLKQNRIYVAQGIWGVKIKSFYRKISALTFQVKLNLITFCLEVETRFFSQYI